MFAAAIAQDGPAEGLGGPGKPGVLGSVSKVLDNALDLEAILSSYHAESHSIFFQWLPGCWDSPEGTVGNRCSVYLIWTDPRFVTGATPY